MTKSIDVEEVEALLSGLTAINACRVVCNSWGAVDEIHVLADVERNPKQIVRDIESALAAKWKLEIDHKKVSVAQVASPEAMAMPTRTVAPSLTLVRLGLSSRPGDETQEVNLLLRDHLGREAKGHAVSTYGWNRPVRIPGKAAVEAINRLLIPGYSLQLDEILTTMLGLGEVAVCHLCLVRPRGQVEYLAGASPLANSDWAIGAVQAVLAAVYPKLRELLDSDTA